MTRAARLLLAILLGRCMTMMAAEDPAPPYVQTQVIAPAEGRGAILGFCVPTGGGLVAVTGPCGQYGAGPRPDAAESPTRRLVWFAADGEEARAVDLDFAATVVGAAPDGGIYVAGAGIVSQLSPEGREVARGTTPHGPKTDEERAELEKSVAERQAMQLAGYEKQVERLRAAVAELDQKVAKAEASDEEEPEDEKARKLQEHRREVRMLTMRTQASRTTAQLRQMEAQVERLRTLDAKEVVEQSLRRPQQARAVTASRDAVFVVAAEPMGFGYAVWRLDRRLENPEKIASGLRGCCGQMDAQVFGERLAIAVNTKHCVELLDFAGQQVGKVGHRAGAADDTAGFGGCCNPMNTCVAPDGRLLVSESNGLVKRFDADGTFVEIVGKAQVKPGCKNSAIAIEPDGSRLYYMDAELGNVIVLGRAEEQAVDDGEQDPETRSPRRERT